jgi:hypothetical protein
MATISEILSCCFSLQKNKKFVTFYVTQNVLSSVSLLFINCIAYIAPNYDRATVNNEAGRISKQAGMRNLYWGPTPET